MYGSSFAQHVRIDLGDRSYDIAVGTGLLGDPAAFEVARAGSPALIVTNTAVGPLYADTLARMLARRHSTVARLDLPDGEVDGPTMSSDAARALTEPMAQSIIGLYRS